MRIEAALLELAVSAGGPLGDRWLAWVVQGGAPPRGDRVQVAWPATSAPV